MTAKLATPCDIRAARGVVCPPPLHLLYASNDVTARSAGLYTERPYIHMATLGRFLLCKCSGLAIPSSKDQQALITKHTDMLWR